MACSAAVEEVPEKHCWVCFATEREDRLAEWVNPCRCKGCTKWIHQSCLQRWLDEKQKGNNGLPVNCPQCGTEYRIVFPKMGLVVYSLEHVDKTISRVSPFAAMGVVVGTVYWSAVTYGAVTVMQVMGHKRGMCLIEKADPVFLLLGLPTIPVMLVLGKMFRWEDYVLKLWHKCSGQQLRGRQTNRMLDRAFTRDHLSVSRTLCGALVFPSIASLVGRVFFKRFPSNLQRTILGGLAFVLLKGALKVYFKQQQFLIQSNRQILNYPETRGEPERDGENERGEEDTEDSGNE